MALAFDFSNVGDPEKIHDGGGTRAKPGRGMAVIKRFSEYTGAKGQAHEVDFEIVSWTDKDSVAVIHTENIFHTDKTGKGFPMKRITCLAMAAGLFNANDVKQWQAAGSQPEIDMTKLTDRPVFIELIEEADQNDSSKKYIRVGNIGLALYHIKDPRCKDWPKNQAIWNAAAAKVGDWIETAKAAPPKQQAANKSAAASVDALFGNV